MKAKGIDFISYTVEDMDKAEAFYRDVLGMTVTTERGEPGTRANGWMELECGDVSIGLTAMDPHPNGVMAVAADDVKAAVEELRGKGVEIGMDTIETPVCFMAAIEDPDGNKILLHQRKDGTHGQDG